MFRQGKKKLTILAVVLLVLASIFAVVACTTKKSKKIKDVPNPQEKQRIEKNKNDRAKLKELQEFMSIKNMQFDVKSEGSSFKTYVAPEYSYNSEKNQGFVNFDSWVHEFKLNGDRVEIGRRVPRIKGFPHYLKGKHVRKQFFSIQASMTDENMYTLAKVEQGGYEFTVKDGVIETTNHNVIESIANSVGSKISYENFSRVLFSVQNNKLNIKLAKEDGSVGVEAEMTKAESSLSVVDQFLSENKEYTTDVKIDDTNPIVLKIKEMIADKKQAYKIEVSDYSHIIAGRTQEDINSENDWDRGVVKKHEVIQYFGNDEAFKFNTRTREFASYRKQGTSELGIIGTYDKDRFTIGATLSDAEFAKRNLIETVFANLDKLSYLDNTDEYIFDYKEVVGFENLLANVLDIENKKFFNENKIDTVTLTEVNNKLCININRRILNNESISTNIVDNVVAIQLSVDVAKELKDVSSFQNPTEDLEKLYIRQGLRDLLSSIQNLRDLIANDSTIVLTSEEENKVSAAETAIKSAGDLTLDQLKNLKTQYSEVEEIVFSKSESLVKKSVENTIAEIKKIANHSELSKHVDGIQEMLEMIKNKYMPLVSDPTTTLEKMQSARKELTVYLSNAREQANQKLTAITQKVKNINLEENGEFLYAEPSVVIFQKGLTEISGKLNTVEEMIERQEKLIVLQKTLRVLTREEERLLEQMRAWYSLPNELFIEPIRETIANAQGAFNAIQVSKRPMAITMIDRLKTFYNKAEYLSVREQDKQKIQELKNKIDNLKTNTNYANIKATLKDKINNLPTEEPQNLKEAIEKIEKMSDALKELEEELNKITKGATLKNEILDLIAKGGIDSANYENGAKYTELLNEIKTKVEDAANPPSYEKLQEYKILASKAKAKLIAQGTAASQETRKTNLKNLKTKLKTFYEGSIPKKYHAEAIDSLSGNKQEVIFSNQKYVFNLTTKQGKYKEGNYIINAQLNSDNKIVSKDLNYFGNPGDYIGHLRHNIDKGEFNRNKFVLNGIGFIYLDYSDEATIPDGVKGLMKLLGYTGLSKIAVINNADNSVTLVGYREVSDLSTDDVDLSFYEVCRIKATPDVDASVENTILESIEQNKSVDWDDLKKQMSSKNIKVEARDGSVNCEITDTTLVIDNLKYLKGNGVSFELAEGVEVASNQELSDANKKIKNDIVDVIVKVIDAGANSGATDDITVVSEFRDLFGITKGTNEGVSIIKVGDQILLKYENANDTYEFKITIK